MASRGLTALPNQQLLDFLNSQMRGKFNRALLIGHKDVNNAALKSLLERTATLRYDDIKSYVFNDRTVESTYFDDEGVFTAIVNLTNEAGYNKHLYAVGLFSDDLIVGTIAKTPIIYLNEQIGGQFPIKIPIKGNEGEVVFRSTVYLPEVEAEERFLSPVIAMWGMNTNIANKMIADEIAQLGEEDRKKDEHDRLITEVASMINTAKSEIEEALLEPITANFGANATLANALIKQEIKEMEENK